MKKMKVKLSTLWLFVVLNYLYCDVVGLYDPKMLNQLLTGSVEGMQFTPEMLFGISILMEIPIVMVLFSRILKYNTNRWMNIAAGLLMTLVQASTLFMGKPTAYYTFFSVIEIATTFSIMVMAWKWREEQV